ncbi:dityrosine synthesis enzyme [Nothophoma quercina]|uniref:Dityrosine synthesis enzyme n=1 Tax=Nothophoma quercina TaxID=749835 RepID=A0ABR3RZY2_9PLEO
MAPFNKGVSTYHCIQGLYWRESNGELLAVEGSNSKTLPEVWPQFKDEICSATATWTRVQLPSGKEIKSLQITADIPALLKIRSNFPPAYEKEELYTLVAEVEHDNGRVLGMVTSKPKSLASDSFSIWAERFILLETRFQPFSNISDSSTPWAAKNREVCNQITEIFERKLKNLSKDDQWDVYGREGFMNRVYGFVDKALPILLALPAFPCKSPNPNKAGGIMPDLAENIALDVIYDFIKEVNAIYEPGATMWIINDGHVFSDCIGVDDEMIDTYDACMAEIYKERFPGQTAPVQAMDFKGLKNIFSSDSEGFQTLKKVVGNAHKMPHPVKTKMTGEAELCRRLMLGIGGADRAYIRSLIEQQEPETLGLYRGQTRFMLEDLADIPSVKSLSGKQKKKTAALVAEEMISRNQGYSNLVELLLPNYVRLSIHAHNNKGPKFAVRLLPKHIVRAIDDLENRLEPVAAYEFQIPTPWHNCMIKVDGDEFLYLAKSVVAKKALASNNFTGSWVNGPDGSYFSLKHATACVPTPTKLVIPQVSVEKITIFDEKKGTIVVVFPMAENRSPIVICSPVVGRKNPIVVTNPDGGRPPIIICSPHSRRSVASLWTPVLQKVRNPVGSPIVRTKTSIAICSSVVEKNGATVTSSPIEPRPFKRVDSHWVRPGEQTSRLRMFIQNNLPQLRSQAV